ncbi:MAG: hypothetical protein AAF490_02750 [Chloroflexota bacterium]
MNNAHEHVLQMLQDGKISAEDAEKLLTALDVSEQPPHDDEQSLTGDVIPTNPDPPNFDWFRTFWRVPFFVSAAFSLLFGLWLRSVYQSSGGAVTFGFICLWSFFMLSLVATAVSFLSRQSPWLHLRVKPNNGPRLRLSFPLPVRIASVGISFAQGFVPNSEKANLEVVAGFLQGARESLTNGEVDPIFIDVDDDDGDQVQVFIG